MSQGILRRFAFFVKLVSNARSKSNRTDNGFLSDLERVGKEWRKGKHIEGIGDC